MIVLILSSLIESPLFIFKTANADPGGAISRPGIPLSLANAKRTTANPFIDGHATYFNEWKDADKLPDLMTDGVTPNAGYYYVEYNLNWLATSLKGNTTTIPGQTLFIAHDLNGNETGDLRYFQIPENTDWNVMEIPTAYYTLTCWVLAQNNTLDDSSWLNASGLANSRLIPEGSGNDLINDIGYIVRKNNDSLTDVHWFPGDPSPGDPGWDPNPLTNKYYGCFGNWNFSDSFYTTGLDPSPYPNEEYEWSVTLPQEEPWCLWWERRMIVILDDVKIYFWVLRGQFWLHFPPDYWEWDWPNIIYYQITDLSDIVLTLPLELRGDVYLAIDLLYLARDEVMSEPRRAMDTIGTAVQHLIEASNVSIETSNVIMNLVALEEDIADKKLYNAEWKKVMDQEWQPEFTCEIWRSYEDLRAAGIEIQKIEEGNRSYTAYDVPISHFQMAWDHAQSAENIAQIALGGDFFSWTPSNPRANETVTFDSSPCLVPGAAVGDFDMDGVVDSTDLGILGAAWGSFEGPPPDSNWNVDADLQRDGVIDSTDLGIMGAFWGAFGNYISEYHWYIDSLPRGSPPTVNYTFASYSKTPHNVTLVVIYGDGNSTAYTQMLTIERDISIFSIWPSMEDYQGSIQFEFVSGKYVIILVRTCNIGTITEYTNNAFGDFPSTARLNLYLIHSDGTEQKIGGTSSASAIRRYWNYTEGATALTRLYDWKPTIVGSNYWKFWDLWGYAPENDLMLKANFTDTATGQDPFIGDTDLSNNELWFGPFNITAGYDHDIRIEGIYDFDHGYYTPHAPYGTNFYYFYGGKFGFAGEGPYNPITPGSVVDVYVDLSNVGTHDETVTWRVYAGSTEIYSHIDYLDVATGYFSFTFQWDTTGYYGACRLSVRVDPVPGETDKWATWDNNLPTQSIPYFFAYDDWGIYTTFPP
jgi:hypothetical protein